VKDKQFVRLQSLVKDENIAVIRGKYGATQAVNIYDLVVGDIVILETGCRVPADCLLLDGLDVTVDESVYYEGENKASKKQVVSEDNFDQYPDPFLLSNSLVATGAGKAVVLCVGERSRRGLKEAKLDTESKTPLQEKLQNLAGQFTKWGLIGAAAVFLALLVNFIIRTAAIPEYQTAGKIMLGISNMFTFAIAIIIVAVPEGLPLAITISLAYSVMHMKNDGLLVRNLDSPEMMGKVDEIITGKTGTLTKSEMKVDQFYSQSILIRNNRKNTLFNCELFDHVIDLIQESILYNNDCRIEMNDEAFWEPIGNGTEVGLIKFLQDAEVPVHDIMKKSFGRVETEFPFSTQRKRQVTAVRHPEKESIVRVYMKGAPEVVVSRCSRTYYTDGKVIPMEDDQTNYILNDILIQKFTTAGYRTLALAFKDIPVDEFERMKQQYNNFKVEDDRIYLEKDLTFLGLFALHDPIRQNVTKSVQFAQRGQINVRMVSGDHLETAKAVAVTAGIMDDPKNFSCLTGEEFRHQVGSLKKTIDEQGNVKLFLERRDVFRSLVNGKDGKPLKVIARASSYDKYLLVVGLRDLGRTVACIGEGLNDVDALSNADVGFAMGSGVSIAKDNSDMILVEDNFESVMKAVMWGRNVYQNVRRFIQFQVTVNLSTLLLVIMGSATKGSSPISINQLLWINLIMDTFAAIALGSERPHPSIILSPPVKNGEALVTSTMWKQIYSMTLYIFAISTVFYFFVDDMWGIEYDNAQEIYEDGNPTPKGVVFTMIFNAFVWMHIFNEFNCRKVGASQYNMFHGLITNWVFLLVLLGIMALQVLLVQYGGEAMQTVPLSAKEHAFCIVWGSTTLLVSTLFKLLVPNRFTEKLPALVNEDRNVNDDKLLKAFNSQAKAKVTSKK